MLTELEKTTELEKNKTRLLDSFKESLENGGESSPVLLLIVEKNDKIKVNIIPGDDVLFSSNEGKNIFRKCVDKLKEECTKAGYNLLYSIFASEAFIYKFKDDQKDKVIELVKEGNFKEVNNMRDRSQKEEVLMLSVESENFQESEIWDIVENSDGTKRLVANDALNNKDFQGSVGIFSNILYKPEVANFTDKELAEFLNSNPDGCL